MKPTPHHPMGLTPNEIVSLTMKGCMKSAEPTKVPHDEQWHKDYHKRKTYEWRAKNRAMGLRADGTPKVPRPSTYDV